MNKEFIPRFWISAAWGNPTKDSRVQIEVRKKCGIIYKREIDYLHILREDEDNWFRKLNYFLDEEKEEIDIPFVYQTDDYESI